MVFKPFESFWGDKRGIVMPGARSRPSHTARVIFEVHGSGAWEVEPKHIHVSDIQRIPGTNV